MTRRLATKQNRVLSSTSTGKAARTRRCAKLRQVLVCAASLAYERLTPTNREDLLFDDVLWVENADSTTRTSSPR